MQRKLFRPLAALAVLALAAGAAQARDNVFFSVGVEAAPGVSVGVSNVRPAVIAPAPVFIAPQPVYVAPRPVVVSQPLMVVEPQPVYVVPGRHHGHKHHHHHHHD